MGDRVLSDEEYEHITSIVPIAATDGVPVRLENGKILVGAIVRNTGVYTGKLALIGGRVQKDESLEESLRRHFRTDIGVEIEFLDPEYKERPMFIAQYKPLPEGSANHDPVFNDDPTKHCISATYLVRIPEGARLNFGEGPGGQEASDFKWFAKDTMPPPSEFAFNHDRIFARAFLEASKLLN